MASAEPSVLKELLERARGGDAAARDRLFEACRNYVCVVARAHVQSWLRTKVDPSDLVQQTLLEAHRGFDDFRGTTEGEWLAWLRHILLHNCADYVRRYRGTEKRQISREVAFQTDGSEATRRYRGAPEPADPGESPSALVMQREQEVLVADALTRLSPEHQEVILLRNLQRLPFDQVAEQMGRSRPAAQMLWMRAIRKLQEQMTDGA